MEQTSQAMEGNIAANIETITALQNQLESSSESRGQQTMSLQAEPHEEKQAGPSVNRS